MGVMEVVDGPSLDGVDESDGATDLSSTGETAPSTANSKTERPNRILALYAVTSSLFICP